jgi:hypothetical protein
VHKLLEWRATSNPEIEKKKTSLQQPPATVVFFNTKPVGVSKTFQGVDNKRKERKQKTTPNKLQQK